VTPLGPTRRGKSCASHHPSKRLDMSALCCSRRRRTSVQLPRLTACREGLPNCRDPKGPALLCGCRHYLLDRGRRGRPVLPARHRHDTADRHLPGGCVSAHGLAQGMPARYLPWAQTSRQLGSGVPPASLPRWENSVIPEILRDEESRPVPTASARASGSSVKALWGNDSGPRRRRIVGWHVHCTSARRK
jgi:hypothetical protein